MSSYISVQIGVSGQEVSNARLLIKDGTTNDITSLKNNGLTVYGNLTIETSGGTTSANPGTITLKSTLSTTSNNGLYVTKGTKSTCGNLTIESGNVYCESAASSGITCGTLCDSNFVLSAGYLNTYAAGGTSNSYSNGI